MLKRLLLDRKGISLTEVVVAMTLVVLITGAAITVVIASIRADAAYQNKYQALTACENAAECLRYSKGDEGLLKGALSRAGFDENKSVTYGNQKVEIIDKTIDETNYYVVKYNDNEVYKYKK